MKKRYPKTLSSGANNTVIALSETEDKRHTNLVAIGLIHLKTKGGCFIFSDKTAPLLFAIGNIFCRINTWV